MEARRADEDSPSVARLISFSDAVIAIAITLLAFRLRLPLISDPSSSSELVAALGRLGDEFRVFGITFVLIGMYWMVHHRAFRQIVDHDLVLAWLNLWFLFGITVLPFASDLLGTYAGNSAAVAIYSGALLNVSIAFLVMSRVALRRGLVSSRMGPRARREGSLRSELISLVFLVSIPVAFVSPTATEFVWLAGIPIALMTRRRMRSAEVLDAAEAGGAS